MRICLFFLMSFCAYSASAQLNESYNDGNFDNDPIWYGNTSAFIINSAKQLQTANSAVSQAVYLSTPCVVSVYSTWDFFVQLSFSPSANNLVRIYLSSDSEDLKGPLNGYFIQVGETGNLDSYDLYRQTGLTVTRILAGKDQVRGAVNLLTARIRVVHDADGLWRLSSDNTGGTDFELSGTAPDKLFSPGKWFGIYAKYTATNSGRFVFDDFLINGISTPPHYAVRKNDVIINEIFADPTPVTGLPDAEFIELLNTTQQTIGLSGWTFTDGSTTAMFPPGWIGPGESLIICSKSDTVEFRMYGKTVGISPWPSLNNSGEMLMIRNEIGSVINQVNYKDSWYRDQAKKEGGWTLELIDPDALCAGSQNWIAATAAKGGTPGALNSVYKAFPVEPLALVTLTVADSVTFRLTFNRAVDTVSATLIGNYLVNNGVGTPLKATPQSPDFLTVTLKFKEPVPRGRAYKLTLEGIKDCQGNLLSPGLPHAELFYPGKVNPDDILISEILFNPKAGGVDFLEIYNASMQVLDLMDLSVANLDDRDSVANSKPASQYARLMLPGQYIALTVDPGNIRHEFTVNDPLSLLKVDQLPAFNDDRGAVVLLSGNRRIDQFNYSEKMHFPLIKIFEGVSLERSSFTRNANDAGNFRSAAGSSGFATPGYRNSQYTEDVSSEEEVFLTSTTFSPDNDGFEDELQVNYQFKDAGKVANAAIYTDRGAFVHSLVKNNTLPANGSFSWNGINSLGKRQRAGIYIVVLEVFDLGGNVSRYKRSCVLAAKLN